MLEKIQSAFRWVKQQIKKHPRIAMGITFLLGGVAFPILHLITAAWSVYAMTAAICIVAGPLLGGCLGWLAEKRNRYNPHPNNYNPHPKNPPSVRSSELLVKTVLGSQKGHAIIISSLLSNKDIANFMTSKSINQVFTPIRKDRLGLKLLQYGIYGEEKKVNAILQNQPQQQLYFLLFGFTATVTDYSGRKIQGNLIRILLGAEDTDMLKKIQPYCITACGDEKKAQDEMKRHYDAQFPAENKEAEEKTAAADLDELKQFIQAINGASDAECQFLLDNVKDNTETNETSVGKARKRFRDYLDVKIKEVITTGKHFNAELLVEALNQYDTNYHTFGDWDSAKNKLAWRQVIGYIQRYVSTCLAQAYCQGIDYIVYNSETLSRSLEFRFSPAVFFPVLHEDGPGYVVAAGWAGVGWRPDCGGDPARTIISILLARFMLRKNREMASLCNIHPSNPKPTTNTRTVM